MRFCRQLAAALLSLLASGSALAGDAEDRRLVERLFTETEIEADWFAEPFLRAVPVIQVREILADQRRRYGPPLRVSGERGDFVVWTGSHRIPLRLLRDGSGRIASLLLRPAEPLEVDLGTTTAALKALPGEVAYLVEQEGEVLAAHRADDKLAVGSAFKLAVLLALHERIESGAADWADVIRLKPGHVSLPSGFLQRMPPGSPLTLHSLAAAMIAESDNTATDSLIDYLGRESVEGIAGLAPLLTTREFFQLKADPELYEDYTRRDLAGRRGLLADLAGRPLPPVARVMTPWRPEAEWLMSARSLCRIIERVGDLDLFRINPGLADASAWARIAYKGGSETGVVNMTTLVTDESGRRSCIVATWNDSAALDETRFHELYRGLLLALRRG